MTVSTRKDWDVRGFSIIIVVYKPTPARPRWAVFKGAQVTGTDEEDEALILKAPPKSTSKAVKGGKGPVQRGEFRVSSMFG